MYCISSSESLLDFRILPWYAPLGDIQLGFRQYVAALVCVSIISQLFDIVIGEWCIVSNYLNIGMNINWCALKQCCRVVVRRMFIETVVSGWSSSDIVVYEWWVHLMIFPAWRLKVHPGCGGSIPILSNQRSLYIISELRTTRRGDNISSRIVLVNTDPACSSLPYGLVLAGMRLWHRWSREMHYFLNYVQIRQPDQT